MEAQQLILDCNGEVERWKGSGFDMMSVAAKELGGRQLVQLKRSCDFRQGLVVTCGQRTLRVAFHGSLRDRKS